MSTTPPSFCFEDLVEKAFNEDFNITKKQAQAICLFLHPDEYVLSVRDKYICVKGLNEEFKWGEPRPSKPVRTRYRND